MARGLLDARGERGWRATLDDVAWLGLRFIIIAIAGSTALYGVLRVDIIIVPLLIAMLLATGLAPVVDRLERFGMPRSAAAAAALLGLVAVVGAGLAAIVPGIASRADELKESVEAGYEDVLDWLQTGPLQLDPRQVADIRRSVESFQGRADDVVRQGVVETGPTVLTFAAAAFLTLPVLFFLLRDGPRMWAWAVSRAPEGSRQLLDRSGRRSWAALRGYLRATAAVAFVDALFIGLGLWAVGVSLALPLAVLTFFFSFVPILGATAAGAVAVLVALADGGITRALIALGIVLLVQQIESNILQPYLVGRALRMHPLVVLLAVTAGGVLAGILGALLATPVAAVIVVVMSELRAHRAAIDAQLPPPAVEAGPT